MHSKKGVIEVQFNWIFILVAGFLIITLFTGIIIKQKDTSVKSKDILVSRTLENILAGSEISTGTVNTLDIPNAKIEFDCGSYTIGDIEGQFNDLNIFSPEVFEGNKIITWTLDWNVPYKVANFVYLVDPKTRYVIIADPGNELANNISNMIPDGIEKDVYDSISDFEYKEDSFVRIIFFDQNPEFPDSLAGKSVTALNVWSNSREAEFFVEEGGEFQSIGAIYYIKEPSLLGAVFSGNPKICNCNILKALKKLDVVSQIYKGKVESLKSEPLARCIYDTAPIDGILLALVELNEDNADEIFNAAKDLETQNKDLQKNSCPLIY